MHVNTWSVGHKEDRARLRSVLSSDRNRGHKLKYRRYGLSTRKRISLWWWAVKVAQKGFGVSHLRLNSYVTCTQSWTACSRGPYLSRVVGPDEFQRSLTPVPCLWYCDLCFRVVFFFFFFLAVLHYLSTQRYQKIDYLRSDEEYYQVYQI